MAMQALEPFDNSVVYFEYSAAETAVRVILRSAPGASTTVTVRSNLLWALKQLPIDQFNSPSIWGVDFRVQWSGEDLYLGTLSNRNRPGGAAAAALEGVGAQGGLNGTEEKQKRGLVITQPSNTTLTTETLHLPGHLTDNTRDSIQFHLVGGPLPDIGIFSAILEFLLVLGSQDPHQAVESAYFARDDLPVGIYVIYNVEAGSAQRLKVYQVVAILHAIVRYAVRLSIYQELVFHLLVDDVLLAVGCVVSGVVGEREWCRGLEGW